MKQYVGTTLDARDFRALAIRAAEAGLSKSAFLKKSALEALERAEKAAQRRQESRKKEVAK